jgi:hypothetical protein
MENNNEKEENVQTKVEDMNQKEKSNKPLLIVVGLILLIVVGVGCFFLGKNTAKNNLNNGDNKENNIEQNNNEEKINTESNEKNDKSKEESNIQDENYELSMCLNCNNFDTDTIIKPTKNYESDLIKVTVKDDNKTIEIKISAQGFSYYGTNIKDRTIIKQLDKEIKQVLITSYGGDVGLLTIHYLLKDGTVEYTKVFDEIQKDNFDNISEDNLFNTKKFNDIKDIIKIVPVLYEGNLPTYGVVAITNDGHFYSLNV